ncbi:hypothetical protein EOPP23_08600 [Endozoicomonas sp. OPT23]|uniref:TonB-dependent receptor n=1 Tax=Endozoicomonas sp. OPT23 TaxID=2072845 RepID=UPI00129A545F|nr:TonB-dependent receptor [Endozoicomonas sp. OPT23]MRI33041.1 hypothetical protein [Endozoicomonas sp. OPT23]
MRVKLAPLALAVAAASASVSAIAEQVTQLDKVVVTATRSEASVSSISGTVQVIDADQVKEQSQPGQKLADILEKLVPGMGPSTQAVTDHTQTIRGRKVLVLIDGISQQDNRQVSRQMNTIRPENIERIEIVSGASAIYGGGAIGGIINVITKNAKNEGVNFATEAGIRVGNSKVSASTLNQSIEGRTGDFDYLLSATYESRGSFYDADRNIMSPDPAQNRRMDTDSKDALIKLGYDFDEQRRFEVSGQVFRDEMDSEYGPDYGELFSNIATQEILEPVKGLDLSTQPFTKRNSVGFTYTDDSFFGHRLSTQAYYREREARFFPFPNDFRRTLGVASPAVVFLNQSTSLAKVKGFKFDLSKDINNLSLSYGVDYKDDKGEQRGQRFDTTTALTTKGLVYKPTGDSYEYGPDVSTDTLGGFFQSSYMLNEAFTLNFGLRHERIEQDIADYNSVSETWFLPVVSQMAGTSLSSTPVAGVKKKYNETLFNTGVVFSLNDQNQLFANYTEGFEAPDAARILRNVASNESQLKLLANANPTLFENLKKIVNFTSVEDAQLDAIKTQSYEMGWRGQFENLNSNITLFYNSSDKTIAFDGNIVSLLDQKKKVYGLEAAAEYFVNDSISVGGVYSFTEGRSYYKDLGKWLDLEAQEVSPQKIVAYTTFAQDDYTVRLQATHFADYNKGRSYSSRTGTVTEQEIDGYTTVDLMASYELPVGTLKAGVSNLFNEKYQSVYSQWAAQAYKTAIVSSNSEGRAYSLSYRVEY